MISNSGRVLQSYIGSLLSRAIYCYSALVGKILDEQGLSDSIKFGMGNALFALYHRDNCTISKLGNQLCVSKSSMTSTVNSLRPAGLVELTPDPDDSRVSRLVLSSLA